MRSGPFNAISIFCLTVVLTCCLTIPTAFALDVEPRLWEHLPLDINVAGVSYAHTTSDIYVDPVLRLEEVAMEMNAVAQRYIRTFGFFGKSARVDVTQMYMDAKWTGLLDGSPVSTSRSGFSDTLVRFAANIFGAPPLRGKEYAEYQAKKDTETIIGTGLVVRFPSGEYMEDKLINLGQNQYVLRPQLGMAYTHKKWTVELTGEVAFSTINHDFYNDSKLRQGPLGIIHANLAYTFRPGLWVGAKLVYDYGGRSTVNGAEKIDHVQDIGWALNFAIPLGRQVGIKISYIGLRTLEAIGSDSNTLSAGVAVSW